MSRRQPRPTSEVEADLQRLALVAPDLVVQEMGRKLEKEQAGGQLRGVLLAAVAVVAGCWLGDGYVGPMFAVGISLAALSLWSVHWLLDRWVAAEAARRRHEGRR